MAPRISIDAVWDDAVRTLRERGGRVAAVALLAFALPSAVQGAVRLYPVSQPAGVALLGLLVSVAGLLLSLWGALAVIGLASDPEPAPAAARRKAGRRLPASLGITATLFAGVVLLGLPLGLGAALAGTDMAAVARGGVPAAGIDLSGRAAGWLALGALLFLAVLVWVGARLLPVQAVVLHERRGLGALGAAFRSTRGLAPRLVGAELLFALVAGVTTLAVQGAAGTVLLVVLGPGRVTLALLLAVLLGALASAVLTALAWVFVARLYAALRAATAVAGPWAAGSAAAA